MVYTNVVDVRMEAAKSRRYLIVVRGNVINVGYRAFVRQAAINLGVRGLVRNKEDYVEIYCEVDGKEQLNSFLNRITARRPVDSEFYDPFQAEVSGEPSIFPEDSGEYKNSGPPSMFGYPFVIDYGFDIKTVKPLDRETIESLNVGKAMMVTKFGYLDYKYDKISSGITNVSTSLKDVSTHMKIYSAVIGLAVLLLIIKSVF